MKKVKLFFLLISLTMSALSYSQVTTSSMSGRVTDGKETLIGATVKAVHEPSGTVYGAVTNNEGRYAIQGMRTGGPYKVEILYLGFSNYVQSNISLQLGETFVLNAQMSESETELDEIVITANASKFTTEKTGASTNINNEQMRLLPSIDRNINDFVRLSPYAAGSSFAGRDGRSNNFTVDGAKLNNNFGLSSALPGGGNPISIDAIEEIQVVVAPYDVRQSNFIGGGINAITKSGTNIFKGTAYMYFNNQDMRGNRIGDVFLGEPDKESKMIYGFTLGGPIIKDKLFFFVNAEKEDSPNQITQWRASQNGVADIGNMISRVKQSDLDEFSRLLKERYGYDTGSSTDFPGGINNTKILGRIDWNINNANKLSLRYNHTQNDNWIPPNENSGDTGYRLNNTFRIGPDAMSYMNSTYSTRNVVNSFTTELNTRINDAMSNQFLVTYTNINDMRGSKSDPFPFIEIMNGDAVIAAGNDPYNSQNFSPYMSAGYELFTWNNGVKNNVFSITDNYTYYMGSHKLTAGLSYEYQSALNSYQRNGTGYYRYVSFQDFKDQKAPEAFALDYGYNNDPNPAGRVAFGQLAAYVQDEWNILDNFKLTGGIRLDNTFFLNDIMTNNAIKELDFGGKQIDTGAWPDTKFQFSPRIGFSWDVFNDKSLKVRGGSGLFLGRLPLVFFTNVPQNGGMVQGNIRNVITTKYANDGSISSRDNRLDDLAGPIITDVNQMIDLLGLQKTITPEQGVFQGGDIAGIDKNFKMPQVWKSSLGIDYQLPVSFPLTVTVEGMFTKDIDAVRLINYNIKDPEANNWARFSGPDDRYIYPTDYKYVANAGVVAALTNTSKGYGYTGNITITAEPVKNLNVMAAYTYTESKEISGMPGSAATSAWNNVPSINGPNFADLERSQYVTPNRVIASLSYHIGQTNTDIGIFYNGFTPYKYSYTYSTDMNGDGINNDLIYIPKTKDEINWATPEDGDRFWAFLEQDKYLKNHKGEYAGAYAINAPWVHRFDLKYTQNFQVKIGKTINTLQLSFDILNFGNMLNTQWGVYKNMNAIRNGQILGYNGRDANFSFFSTEPVTETFTSYNNVDQTWRLQVGLRYIFN